MMAIPVPSAALMVLNDASYLFRQQHPSATVMAAQAVLGANITFRRERYSPFVIVSAVSTAHHAVLVNAWSRWRQR